MSAWIRLTPEGRGAHYSWRRGLIESALRQLYRGGWPARLWQRVPGAIDVEVVSHVLELGRASGNGKSRLRIGFASDLHLGPTTPEPLIAAAVAALRRLEPDIVLLGGDFVFMDANREILSDLRRLLSALPQVPKFSVWGNHDLWTRHDLLEATLAEVGVEVLANRHVALDCALGPVAICGIDDPWTGRADGALAVPSESTMLKIGLAHSPDGIVELADRQLALLLCGHTHGGQIALPGGRPIVLPPGPHSRRMPRGRYQHGGMAVIVSKGVGATELPIRTHAKPEVISVDIIG